MSLINSIKDFAFTKTRLFVEYIIISILLVVIGLCVFLWTDRDQMNQMIGKIQTDLTMTIDANIAQDNAIAELLKTRQQDLKSLKEYIEKSNMLQDEKEQLTEQLNELEKSNEQIKAYLDVPLHPHLIQLLDKATDGIYNGYKNPIPSSANN